MDALHTTAFRELDAAVVCAVHARMADLPYESSAPETAGSRPCLTDWNARAGGAPAMEL